MTDERKCSVCGTPESKAVKPHDVAGTNEFVCGKHVKKASKQVEAQLTERKCPRGYSLLDWKRGEF